MCKLFISIRLLHNARKSRRDPSRGIARGDRQGAVSVQKRTETWGCVCGERLFEVQGGFALWCWPGYSSGWSRRMGNTGGGRAPLFSALVRARDRRCCAQRRPAPREGSLPSISIPRGKAWTDSCGAGEDLSWRQRKPLGFTTSFLMGQSLSPRGAPAACRLPRQATSGIDPLATPSLGTEPASDTDSLNEGRGLNPGDTVVVRVTAKKRMPPRRPRLGSS